MAEHLPECRTPKMVDLLAERGQEIPEELKDSDVRIQLCAKGCPRSAEIAEDVKLIARERGWLTDSGWVWEADGGE